MGILPLECASAGKKQRTPVHIAMYGIYIYTCSDTCASSPGPVGTCVFLVENVSGIN